MWPSQRFKRVPHQDPGEDADLELPTYPLQTKMDIKSDMKTYHSGSFEPMRTDTEYTAGVSRADGYTVSHRRTMIERLEEHEHRRFGTRVISFFYNNFVAGWRAGLLRAFLFSLSALIVNISVYLWLFLTYEVTQGSGLILKANCSEVNWMVMGIKGGLNVLSTLILGASTFAMQSTTSPTREEVDKAHLNGKWLEIGTQSWRNLAHVSRRHACIWTVLAITSLPLHLVFNAVFFTTTEAYQYSVAVVDQSFINNTAFLVTSENSSPAIRFQSQQLVWPLSKCNSGNCTWDIPDDDAIIRLLNNVRDPKTRRENYTQLSRQLCLESYSQGFMQEYSDVVVISKETQIDSPVLWTRYRQSILSADKMTTNPDPFHWVCHDELEDAEEDRCSRKYAFKTVKPENWTAKDWTVEDWRAEDWTVYGHPVDYCFARREPGICHLQYNAYIMLAVVVFSTIKVLAIAFLVFTHPDGDFLRTIGDAIASFLKKQDPTTKNMCLVTSEQIRKYGFTDPHLPQTFTNARPRWWTGANTTEFFSTVGISASFVVIISGTLYWAIKETNDTAFDSGLGKPNIQSLANLRPDDVGSSVIVPTIIIANIPQLGFSLLYVFYTNLWSKLLVTYEFDRLTRVKKGLRVSERPKGQQRTSHFFTLPTRYALPLMACSAALHWLCSQSLFMARFDGMRDGKVDKQDRMVRLGYNVTGMIVLISVNFGMMVATICIAGFRRLSTSLGEMSMSVIISAACHINRHEYEPWLQAVQWGDVSEGTGEVEDGPNVRHCAFTSLLAKQPIEHRMYQ